MVQTKLSQGLLVFYEKMMLKAEAKVNIIRQDLVINRRIAMTSVDRYKHVSKQGELGDIKKPT